MRIAWNGHLLSWSRFETCRCCFFNLCLRHPRTHRCESLEMIRHLFLSEAGFLQRPACWMPSKITKRQWLFYHYHTSHSTTRRVTVYKRLRPQLQLLETIGRLTIAQPGPQVYRNLLALAWVFGMKTTTGFYVNKCGSTNLRFAIGGYWWPPSQVLSPIYSVDFSSPSYSLFEKHDSIWCK